MSVCHIARIAAETEILPEWSFSGRDIFVLPNGESHLEPFKIQGEELICYDWAENKYILDKFGKEII
jgi:hypothetical protein